MRINISINDELIKEIDEACKELYISRSAYIAMAVKLKLQNDTLIQQLPNITAQMQELQKTISNIDDNGSQLKFG